MELFVGDNRNFTVFPKPLSGKRQWTLDGLMCYADYTLIDALLSLAAVKVSTFRSKIKKAPRQGALFYVGWRMCVYSKSRTLMLIDTSFSSLTCIKFRP